MYITQKRKRGEYMTQKKENEQRNNKFNALFMNLNEKGQEAALNVLMSLDFAQSVMYSQMAENQHNQKK